MKSLTTHSLCHCLFLAPSIFVFQYPTIVTGFSWSLQFCVSVLHHCHWVFLVSSVLFQYLTVIRRKVVPVLVIWMLMWFLWCDIVSKLLIYYSLRWLELEVDCAQVDLACFNRYILFPFVPFCLFRVVFHFAVKNLVYFSDKPRREAGDISCFPPVWNLRAVIWFPFPTSSLVFSA